MGRESSLSGLEEPGDPRQDVGAVDPLSVADAGADIVRPEGGRGEDGHLVGREDRPARVAEAGAAFVARVLDEHVPDLVADVDELDGGDVANAVPIRLRRTTAPGEVAHAVAD